MEEGELPPDPQHEEFERFVLASEGRLREGLVAAYGPEDGREAAAEALLYAWQHWKEVAIMRNPVGYLYRVGQTAQRHQRRLRRPVGVRILPSRIPEIEPGLVSALASLPLRQRTAVVLVYGFEWSPTEAAELLDISLSTIRTHLERGLTNLRRFLEVSADA